MDMLSPMFDLFAPLMTPDRVSFVPNLESIIDISYPQSESQDELFGLKG